MRVFCVFFYFFRAKIWPAAAGTGELARDLRDQTRLHFPFGAVWSLFLIPTGDLVCQLEPTST